MTELIEELYPSFLELGYTPDFFWSLTLAEIYDLIESNHRRQKQQQQEKEFELKRDLITKSILARMIGENIAYILDGKNKPTDVMDMFPELFKEERKEKQQKQAENEWKIHQARFRVFSELHNSKRRKEEDKCQHNK